MIISSIFMFHCSWAYNVLPQDSKPTCKVNGTNEWAFHSFHDLIKYREACDLAYLQKFVCRISKSKR